MFHSFQTPFIQVDATYISEQLREAINLNVRDVEMTFPCCSMTFSAKVTGVAHTLRGLWTQKRIAEKDIFHLRKLF